MILFPRLALTFLMRFDTRAEYPDKMIAAASRGRVYRPLGHDC
jgi:hypothetical protein